MRLLNWYQLSNLRLSCGLLQESYLIWSGHERRTELSMVDRVCPCLSPCLATVMRLHRRTTPASLPAISLHECKHGVGTDTDTPGHNIAITVTRVRGPVSSLKSTREITDNLTFTMFCHCRKASHFYLENCHEHYLQL